MFCFECGTELSENETLCSQCGTPVNTEDTPEEPPVEEATPAQEAPVDTEEPALEDVAEQEQPEKDTTVSQDTLSLLLADVKESFHMPDPILPKKRKRRSPVKSHESWFLFLPSCCWPLWWAVSCLSPTRPTKKLPSA